MALQLIIGRAGAGKSYHMYKMMCDCSMQAPKENFIAVVPEQYSMETQKNILDLHEKHGSFNIEVTSFVRMAYTVFEEQGFNDFQVMDDLGKTLVMRKILEDCKEELVLYKNKISMPGFAEKMKTVISELKQYSISNEDIDEKGQAIFDRPMLQQKLKDIATINSAFNNFIEEKMITPEDVLHILCENIPQSDWVKRTNFYFDGYTGFTPAQYKVIEQLMIYSKDVTVTITLPEDEADFSVIDEYELFALSKETISKLRHIAQENQVEENPVIIAGLGSVPKRIEGNEKLCHIEANIFRNRNAEKINNAKESIEILSSTNPHKEAQMVARKIAWLVVQKGMRYREIAVVTGDMDTYYRFLEEEFAKCHIPAFIDHKSEITSNPYVDGIIAALEVIEKDFTYESVLRFLRLGITGIDNYKLDIFENYLIRTGRRGYKSYCQNWEKVFKDMPEGHIDIINEVRQTFVKNIETLRQSISGKTSTISQYTKAVYQMIVDLEFQRQLEEYVQYFNEHNIQVLAREYGQVYGSIIDLLDKLVSLMGEEIITLLEYKQILISGFENIKVGVIPPGADMVMVGDLERTRLKDVKKVIFIMGVNDGVIPKTGGGDGIITDTDREFLGQHNLLLAPTVKDNIFKQKLYLYSLLAKPTEKIIFTFSNMANDGSVLRKSYLIEEVQKLFTDLIIQENKEDITNASEVINKSIATGYVAENFRNYRWNKEDDLFEQINSVLLNDEEYSNVVKLMAKGAYFKAENPMLEAANAIRLYGAKDNIKVTALEQYARCPFSQFVSRGLRLKDRPQHTIEDFDIGNLYHSAIDIFFKEVGRKKIDWQTITEEESHSILEEAIEKTMTEYENDALETTARNRFLRKQVKETATLTVDTLLKHIKAGEFVPAEYELGVRSGRVDRVDVAEADNNLYVKVIDYKSGSKKFNLNNVYEGLDLQLMMYLKDSLEYSQAKNPEKQVLPAGAFYFKIKNPYIDTPNFDEVIKAFRVANPDADVTDEYIKEDYINQLKEASYKMDGLVDDNIEVLKLMDRNITNPSIPSNILPVSKTKSGIRKTNSAIDSRLYGQLLEHVAQKADAFRDEIVNGNIDISPIKGSCDYCAYAGICGFDPKLGYKYRELEKHTMEQITEELLGDNDDSVDR